MRLREAFLAICDVAIPPTCGACGLPGEEVCAGCRAALRPITGPLCARCGHPYAVEVRRCAACRGRVEGARAAVRYETSAPPLVRALKDGGRPHLAAALAEAMAAHTPPPPAEALVPIPLSAARQRRRGFNQSAMLADALAARWGIPRRDLLIRAPSAGSQRGAGVAARAARVRGAFGPAPGAVCAESVCLIDDVHTTGATLAAAAHALRAAGARRICARSFARALRRG